MAERDTKDDEAWLRRFRPRAPRPELRAAILARCAAEPEAPGSPRRRWPWLDYAALGLVAAALAVDLAVEATSRRRLRGELPLVPTTRAEREASAFLDAAGLASRPRERERLVSRLAPRRGRGVPAHGAIDARLIH